MKIILSLGSNIGNRKSNLEAAKVKISEKLNIIFESQIYESKAVENENQSDFLNQLLEIDLPKNSPLEILNFILDIESNLGRVRTVDKGPRVIDIDIIFWGTEVINKKGLTVPHAAWSERSFIVFPLRELPFFKTLEKSFIIPTTFNNTAIPLKK